MCVCVFIRKSIPNDDNDSTIHTYIKEVYVHKSNVRHLFIESLFLYADISFRGAACSRLSSPAAAADANPGRDKEQ